MKTVRFLLVIFACGLAFPAWAQVDARVQGLRFYEQLAQRDTKYEIALYSLDSQDQMDYWIDQGNFERQLGKVNFPAYLAYMKGKKEAYQTHLTECDTQCENSELFFQKAKDYLSLSDNDFWKGMKREEMVHNQPKKKRLK